jgi:hypothetical protein
MHDDDQATSVVEYPKTAFTIGAAGCLIGIALCAFLAFDALEEFARTVWTVTAIGLAVLLAVFIAPCMLTSHALEGEGLHLRMGLLINRTIPYSAIREVAPDTARRSVFTTGIGVRHKEKSGTIFVTSSFSDFVSVRLNRELKLGGVLSPSIGHIVLSVKDVDGFVEEITTVGGIGKEG